MCHQMPIEHATLQVLGFGTRCTSLARGSCWYVDRDLCVNNCPTDLERKSFLQSTTDLLRVLLVSVTAVHISRFDLSEGQTSLVRGTETNWKVIFKIHLRYSKHGTQDNVRLHRTESNYQMSGENYMTRSFTASVTWQTVVSYWNYGDRIDVLKYATKNIDTLRIAWQLKHRSA
jgi:hypothetical protein